MNYKFERPPPLHGPLIPKLPPPPCHLPVTTAFLGGGGDILRYFRYWIQAGPSISWSWVHYLMSSREGEWEGSEEESIVFPLKYINQVQWREFPSIWKVLAADNSWARVENNLWTTTKREYTPMKCMRVSKEEEGNAVDNVHWTSEMNA